MSNIDDLMSFWGEDSAIVKKATVAGIQKYELPDVQTPEGENVFRKIGFYLVQINQKKMEEQGFISLDDEWANSDNPNIVESRGQLYGDYPAPFCGRRVYLIKIPLEEKQITDDRGVTTKKIIQRLQINTRKDGSEYMMFTARVCVFHNEELGWNPKAKSAIKKSVNDKNEVIAVVDTEPYQYRYATVFTDKEIGTTSILPYVAKKIDADPALKNIMVFVVAPRISKKKKDNVENEEALTADDYWYTVNLDDLFMI